MKDIEKAVSAVAEVMDMTPAAIRSKRRFPEVVDARWVTVYLLRQIGLYPHRIAECMGMTARNVNLIVSLINNGERKDLGRKAEEARKIMDL